MNEPPSAHSTSPASRAERIAARLIRWRWLLLAAGAALTAAAYFPAQRLDFDRSVENMFAPHDPLLKPYRQLKRTFGGNEVVVAAYVDPQLMTPQGIERVARLTKQLRAVDGVQSVLSLTSTPLGEHIIDDNALSRKFLDLLENYAVGADRQTAAVVCMLQPNVLSDARARTIEHLEAAVRRHDPSGVLAGEPVMVVEGFRLIEEDGRWLGAVSTVLLMLTIVLCFRSVRWMILPLVVVNATLLMTEGLLVVCQLQLSMVSSMLWAIVTVVGIATVIHILVHFRELREQNLGPRESLRLSLAVLLVPVLWTCSTDAAGFGSLLCASVGPVRDFGVMMTLGSLLSLVGLALFLPGLALAGPAGRPPRQAFGESFLEHALRKMMNGALRWPKTLMLVVTAVAGLSAWGCLSLEVETDFTKNFRADSSLVKSYQLVESRLRGAGVWDVIVPAPDSPTVEFLDRLRNSSGGSARRFKSPTKTAPCAPA